MYIYVLVYRERDINKSEIDFFNMNKNQIKKICIHSLRISFNEI